MGVQMARVLTLFLLLASCLSFADIVHCACVLPHQQILSLKMFFKVNASGAVRTQTPALFLATIRDGRDKRTLFKFEEARIVGQKAPSENTEKKPAPASMFARSTYKCKVSSEKTSKLVEDKLELGFTNPAVVLSITLPPVPTTILSTPYNPESIEIGKAIFEVTTDPTQKQVEKKTFENCNCEFYRSPPRDPLDINNRR